LKKDIFLQGEQISLRILNESDVEGNYAKWLNDPEITRHNSHGRFPMTIEKLKEYVKDVKDSNACLVLAVVDNLNHRHIGNISIQNINWIDRNAEIAFLLGEKEYWGRGVMLEAGKMLIHHAFNVLNLHRIYCGTSSENSGMQKLAEKLGMDREGTRKEAIFKDGKYSDIIEYGIVATHDDFINQ
jgi:[ribosomal protein S5]-alanine N-acetyltransferase